MRHGSGDSWPEPVKNLSAMAFLATEQRIPELGNDVLQTFSFGRASIPGVK